MARHPFIPMLLTLPLVGISSSAQVEKRDPLDVGQRERVETRLVLLDAVVVDREGNPVPGLQREDFEIRTPGETFVADVLETRCEDTWTIDEAVIEERERPPRRLVLLFDYLHLPVTGRERALDTAMRMVREGITEGDEVMVAALTGGLRIELPFTADASEVLGTLRRMQKDISLWNGNFGHASENGFVRGITSLFDVLDAASGGPKAVVFYSEMMDTPLDLQFDTIASVAATSRSAIHTVDTRGLAPPNLELDATAVPPP